MNDGTPLFTAVSSRKIASLVSCAKQRVIYAAPGMQPEVATALADLLQRPDPPSVTVSIDFDEHTLRMGYGSIEAVEILKHSGLEPTQSP